MREAKEELKRRIVHYIRGRLNRYYLQHPERHEDERGKDEIKIALEMTEECLRLINMYHIHKDDPPVGPPDLLPAVNPCDDTAPS